MFLPDADFRDPGGENADFVRADARIRRKCAAASAYDSRQRKSDPVADKLTFTETFTEAHIADGDIPDPKLTWQG